MKDLISRYAPTAIGFASPEAILYLCGVNKLLTYPAPTRYAGTVARVSMVRYVLVVMARGLSDPASQVALLSGWSVLVGGCSCW